MSHFGEKIAENCQNQHEHEPSMDILKQMRQFGLFYKHSGFVLYSSALEKNEFQFVELR